MCVVVTYTVVSHAGYAFEEQPAHWVMQPFFKDNTVIGKYASGLEGDQISIQESGVFVNDELVTEGYLLASKIQVPANELYKSFVVPKGKVFFTGSAPKSYDSRYWGLADQKQIIGEAIPLW